MPKFIDSIPVLGHAKGMLHYVVGDIEGGNRAMFEATRSAAVMAGGAAGMVGGPAGVAVGAVAIGMFADLLASAATGNPEGVLAAITDLESDINNGEITYGSIFQLGLCVAGDVVGGIGGATVANSVKKAAEEVYKNVVREVAKTVIKNKGSVVARTAVTQAVVRAFTPESSSRQPKRNKSKMSHDSTKKDAKAVASEDGDNNLLGSGSDPPKRNPNKIKKEYQEEPETHWTALFKIFKASSLDDIRMGRSNIQIFKGLEDGQKKSLKTLISRLRKHGDFYFTKIIKIVLKFFHEFDDEDVTFQNFISIVQFVLTYVGEQVAYNNDVFRTIDKKPTPFENRLELSLDVATAEILMNFSPIWNTYRNLISPISCKLREISPRFRNEFSALYHYYKHRFLPDQLTMMSVERYFQLIHSILDRLKRLPQFYELSKSRRELVFEKYLKVFGRRLKAVLKVQDNNIELSSCYFVTIHVDGDKDGDEYLDGVKINQWLIFILLYKYDIFCILIAFIICLLSVIYIYKY